ncbi:MAG TPA: monofunctional biosynthetic peptidoglycan transglycosylase, partial [Cytophagales bacterium]|nr:monofunctional biosynthetic peptidoglycan transglycosylase [Cytophagales bacterium]
VLVAFLYRFIPVPFTPLMCIRLVEKKMEGKPMRFKKDWVDIEEAGPMPIAAMAGEDAKFMEHMGFDFDAINKAMDYNKTHRKKKGASTISQQTAKNVFLWPGRTWLRKGLEVYFTVLIELLWPKERILEVYVNVIEMGDGIYGVEAASKYYFKKPARKMNRLEAAKIAAILPSPRRWSVKNPSAYVTKRQLWIRNNMDYIKEIDI